MHSYLKNFKIIISLLFTCSNFLGALNIKDFDFNKINREYKSEIAKEIRNKNLMLYSVMTVAAGGIIYKLYYSKPKININQDDLKKIVGNGQFTVEEIINLKQIIANNKASLISILGMKNLLVDNIPNVVFSLSASSWIKNLFVNYDMAHLVNKHNIKSILKNLKISALNLDPESQQLKKMNEDFAKINTDVFGKMVSNINGKEIDDQLIQQFKLFGNAFYLDYKEITSYNRIANQVILEKLMHDKQHIQNNINNYEYNLNQLIEAFSRILAFVQYKKDQSQLIGKAGEITKLTQDLTGMTKQHISDIKILFNNLLNSQPNTKSLFGEIISYSSASLDKLSEIANELE